MISECYMELYSEIAKYMKIYSILVLWKYTKFEWANTKLENFIIFIMKIPFPIIISKIIAIIEKLRAFSKIERHLLCSLSTLISQYPSPIFKNPRTYDRYSKFESTHKTKRQIPFKISHFSSIFKNVLRNIPMLFNNYYLIDIYLFNIC